MESMVAPTKSGIVARLRNSKGFSLVEMAIVLVIIGIIIGAIVKGQDLILNSRAKQVTAAVSTWRNLVMAYTDRNGRLPGDRTRSAIIGDDATALTGEQVAGSSAIDEIVGTMTNAPANPIVVGGVSFWVYFGNVAASAAPNRNVIVLCGAVDCATAFTADQLEYIKAVDTAEDGIADGGLGQFRAMTVTPTLVTLTAVAGRTNSVVTAGTVLDVTANGTTIPWVAGTHKAAAWAFDRIW